ncbi:MAG: dihydrofolate reductase [Bacteroidia bacterium]|nr:dihydrofolate reductase [Bacteroidia bacterium]
MLAACKGNEGKKGQEPAFEEFLWKTETFEKEADQDFRWKTEQFADLKIVRYQVPGFEQLDLKKKKLLYYLYEAALSGRDMIYDQNYKHNLAIRRTLENIYNTYSGDKSGTEWQGFEVYLKRVWFSNGIHHHYSSKKLVPGFTEAYFDGLVKGSDQAGFPLEGETDLASFMAKIKPIIFDPEVDAKRVNKDGGVDMVTGSANNFYEGMSQAEAEAFYDNMIDKEDDHAISYGLNSKLVKEGDQIMEKVYKSGGMYGGAIEKIVYWLQKASEVAESPEQKAAFDKLVEFYQTGDLKVFDEYSIAWVNATKDDIDVINGFIEVYGDPMGYKGSFESVVELNDFEASARMEVVAANAQYFENNSPIMDEHKKKNVIGVSYKVVNVVMEAGDASPSTPIGINLPNANWIRADYGSKSVSLGNIVEAYDKASGYGGLDEFAYSDEEKARAKAHGGISDKMHTALHEVIGHASGQIEPGIGTPKQTLKNYASTLEEGRADLVALYYLMDPKLIELGLIETLDVGKCEYDSYIRNGMMYQLRRLELGENVEEDHMRNRQLIAQWCFEKGAADNVIEKKVENNKTYYVINDYDKLRDLFGQLLREIQRIKSKGDFEAAKALVEGYGVKVDQALHKEVLDRAAKLTSAPYGGFINPSYEPVMDEKGEIIDVKIIYPDDFTKQHLDYSKTHSFLPTYN